MSDFVEQCRREWKRLGVPDAVAEEMAADLTTDLGEAEAEGVSPEELLGTSDPRSFAASWATERGVIPVLPGRLKARRGPLGLVAFTTVSAIALISAALLLLTGEPRVSVTTMGTPSSHLQSPLGPATPIGPSGHILQTSAAAPVEWILLALAIIALAFAAWLWSSWGSRPRTAPA